MSGREEIDFEEIELTELDETEYITIEDFIKMVRENPEAFPDVVIRECFSDYDLEEI